MSFPLITSGTGTGLCQQADDSKLLICTHCCNQAAELEVMQPLHGMFSTRGKPAGPSSPSELVPDKTASILICQ